MQIYTDKAEQALKLAKKVSARLKHPYIGTEHILIGLLEETSGAAGQVLAGAGVTEEADGYDQPADRSGGRQSAG